MRLDELHPSEMALLESIPSGKGLQGLEMHRGALLSSPEEDVLRQVS